MNQERKRSKEAGSSKSCPRCQYPGSNTSGIPSTSLYTSPPRPRTLLPPRKAPSPRSNSKIPIRKVSFQFSDASRPYPAPGSRPRPTHTHHHNKETHYPPAKWRRRLPPPCFRAKLPRFNIRPIHQTRPTPVVQDGLLEDQTQPLSRSGAQ